MIAYVDSSVLLRIALGQPQGLQEWPTITRGVASALVATESLRTLDRLRLRVRLSNDEVARRRATILRILDSLEIVEVDVAVLDRAAQPMPTELGTLDAVHLASALLWQAATGTSLTMATHDAPLAAGARAHGMTVIGSAQTL